MKLIMMLLLCMVFQLQASSLAQTITIEKNNMAFVDFLREVKKQTGYTVICNSEIVSGVPKLNVHLKDVPLKKALDDILTPKELTHYVEGKSIVVRKLKNEPFSQQKDKEVTNIETQQQEYEVTGKVVDKEGGPLSGVSVVVKGKETIGTATDRNGRFVLVCPSSNLTLIFRQIGFLTQEIAVSSNKSIEVTLEVDSEGLEEVVVVGFGTQKKISLVGAQSSVQADELKQPVRNMSNAIIGRLSGLIGVHPSGEPGFDDARLRVRGIATMTNTNPLILVDGIERPLSNLEPDDIENFTLLKDAAATAVYGVRGANGVILINTKRGAIGKPRISVSYNQGITSFVKTPLFADGPVFMETANEANITRDKPAVFTEDQITKTRSGEDPYLFPNVNWQDEIFKNHGSNRKLYLNVNGGSERMQFNVSGSYFSEDGMFKTDELSDYSSSIKLDRVNFNSSLVINATNTTKLDLGISGYVTDGNYPGAGTADIFGSVMQATPVIFPAKYPDGKIAGYTGGQLPNPYEKLTQSGYVSNFTNKLQSNLRLTQDLSPLVEGLSFNTLFSYDTYNSHRIARNKTVDLWMATGRDVDGELVFPYLPERAGTEFMGFSRTNTGDRQIYWESTLNYNNVFGKHDVGAMLLYNQSDKTNSFANDFMTSLSFRYQGLAGRTTYSYDTKYIFEFNFGYNGSETFAPAKRFGFFPSVGLGWVVSNEKFFDPVLDYVDLFKIRLSHGQVGNGNIGGRRFAYIATVNSSATGFTFGKNYDNAFSGRAMGEYESDVSWEIATKSNIGIDLNTWNNAITLQMDFFKERRTDIFLRRSSMPHYVGNINEPYGNVGEMENKGIDANIGLNKQFGDWFLGVKGNFTYATNMVIEDDKPPYAYPWMEAKGRSAFQHTGYVAEKLFESYDEIRNSSLQTGDVRPGDIKFKDLNGDGKIDQYDETKIGFADYPEIVYGFGLTTGWKGFELGAFFQGATNFDIYVNGEGFQPFQQGGNRGNLLSNITDRWTEENPSQNVFYPRLSFESGNMNYAKSSWWIKDASYLRLKTLELGYNVDSDKIKRMGMRNLRLFVIGYNVWTLSPFKLWDVELGNGRGANYPNIKSFNIGAEIKF